MACHKWGPEGSLSSTSTFLVTIDAFPYNGPGTSNGASPAGRDRVVMHSHVEWALHGEKGMEDAEISSQETSGRPDSWRTIWGSRRPPQWKNIYVGLEARPRDWCPRQRTIGRYDRHSITGERILLFFSSLSHEAFFYSSFFWEWCSYSENQNAAALLQSLLRRTQHCRFPPSQSGFA